MADMLNVGKASTVGFKTVAWYMFTTLLASIEGLLWVLIFRPWFSSKDGEDQEVKKALALKCQNGKYIESINETFACTGSDISNSTQFEVVDINNVFKLAAEPYVRLSLSDALQDQLKQMVPDNITQAFAISNLLSIIMFAIPFGIAISTLPTARDGMNRLLELFRLLNEAFMMMIRGAIVLTPIAVFFMIGGSLATQDNLGQLMEDVGVLILTVVCGLVIHVVFVLPGFLAFIIKKNPYPYMRQMFEAQVFALCCSSSMATLPVTMKCVENTGEVPATLAKFVLSLGATINMDGSAIYYPAAIVFMAETAGFGDQLGGVELFLLVILSIIGAVGSAPVPSAGLVMIITIWNSVFPSIPLPNTFTYIIATDWLLDRGITAVNITGDTVIARIIVELVGLLSKLKGRVFLLIVKIPNR
jgi:Na+/H+-dicarboxylate symporter